MSTLSNFRSLIPEEVELYPTDYLLAQQWSNQSEEETVNWQSFLNSLAVIAFERWLEEGQKKLISKKNLDHISEVAYLEINGFKLCLIAQEDYLEEEIIIPKKYLQQPEFAAHFYGIVEVVEESEFVILRGVSQRTKLNYQSVDAHNYRISIHDFDPELNHFLADCRYLEPQAIPLPQNQLKVASEAISQTVTKLGKWLEGVVSEGWQTLDQLMMPEAQLAFATRSLGADLQRGKLIDLGVSFGQQQVVLLITLAPAEDEKIRIQARLSPYNSDYLPNNLTLSLKSRGGKVIQAVETRGKDSYIQLKPFKSQVGKTFQLEVSGNDFAVSETFEL
jgi:hypothetical protein